MSGRGYGPETRGIIDAINGLKKPAHEDTTYRVINIDLTVARANELYELEGWFDFLAVGSINGSASIRINEPTKDLIDLSYLTTMRLPIRRLYLTNDAQAGAELVLGLGGDASFDANLLRTAEPIFRYYSTVAADLELTEAETATPTRNFAGRVPPQLKSGTVLRVYHRLNPTNVVTYTLRIYADALADDNLSRLRKIYESPAARAGNVAYDVEVEVPFILTANAVMWFAVEWSAAAGATTGFIEAAGRKVE